MFTLRVGILEGLVAIAVSASVLPGGQSGGIGLQFTVRAEVLRPATRSPLVEKALARMAPDGVIETEYITDGRAARRVQHGRSANDPDGTIILVRAGESNRLVLDSASRTFYVRPAWIPPSDPASRVKVTLRPTGTFETLTGYKAQKILVSYRGPLERTPGGEPPAGASSEIVTDIQVWCAPEIRVPASVTTMMNPLVRVAADPAVVQQFAKACPLPLRSSVTNSLMPGYAVVSTVTMIRRASPSPDLFRLPANYRERPAPERAP
jgi:hypothetical protein